MQIIQLNAALMHIPQIHHKPVCTDQSFCGRGEEETLSQQFPSLTTLINLIYCRHVGEKVRMDLQRKQNLPANKLANLMAKFDEVKNGGNMMPTATLAMGTMEGKRVTSYRDFLVNDENICQSRHKCCAVISNSKVCI